MTEHTPGPWRVYDAYDIIRAPGMVAATRIGTLLYEDVIRASPYGYSEINLSKGDAHLICAAPDLLAACEAAYDAMMRYDFGTLTLAPQLKAAIAKARGEVTP